MGNRVYRVCGAILITILVGSTPIYATPIAIREVVQVIVSGHNPPRLQLNAVSQYAAPHTNVFQQSSDRAKGKAASASSKNSPDSLLRGTTVDPDAGGSSLSVIDEGEVEGTICDCGEIPPPGNALPKWPLLLLGAVPLFPFHACGECATPTSASSAMPSLTLMLESASLFLFGLALLVFAGLRRHRPRTIRMPFS
ncbi:MAG TPA: PEP-CTERM sorting domain-containing protein [Pyrinomonadaceae bacterium]|nr:PEP-CTERM sorting domain-containing protein [Pyrinomonadaceae bacterium]